MVAALLMGSCATSRDNHIAAIKRLETIDPESMFSANGLTENGCGVLFPDMDSAQCYKEWHKLSSTEDKLAYLQEKASPIMRGLWEVSRKNCFRDGVFITIMKKAYPNITDQEVEHVLAKLDTIDSHQKILDCLSVMALDGDECILAMAKIASADEVSAAMAYILALRTDPDGIGAAQQVMFERAPLQVQRSMPHYH